MRRPAQRGAGGRELLRDDGRDQLGEQADGLGCARGACPVPGDQGLEPVADTPAQAKARLAEDIQRWAGVIKATGIKTE